MKSQPVDQAGRLAAVSPRRPRRELADIGARGSARMSARKSALKSARLGRSGGEPPETTNWQGARALAGRSGGAGAHALSDQAQGRPAGHRAPGAARRRHVPSVWPRQQRRTGGRPHLDAGHQQTLLAFYVNVEATVPEIAENLKLSQNRVRTTLGRVARARPHRGPHRGSPPPRRDRHRAGRGRSRTDRRRARQASARRERPRRLGLRARRRGLTARDSEALAEGLDASPLAAHGGIG